MHSHCASCLRHAFPSLRCTLRIFAVPLRFFARPCHAFPIYAMPLLIEAKHFIAILRISRIFPCSAAQRNAVPLHCRQGRASPLPRCSKLCNAFADRQDSLSGVTLPSHCLTLLFLCHATPRRCPSMPRVAFPLLFSATLLPAYQFLYRSIHCDDVPLLINSIPSCANPLQIKS